MHPILIDLGRIQVRSYGFMLAVSFLLGIWLAGRRAKRYGVDPQKILDLSVIIILAAVVGSRLLYVLFHLDQFRIRSTCSRPQGATFYGVSAGVGGVLLVIQLNPSFSLSPMSSRRRSRSGGVHAVGCLPLLLRRPRRAALVFPPDSPAGNAAAAFAAVRGLDHVALHPTQVYSSFKGLVIFLVLMIAQRHLTGRGALFGLFLVLYGIGRFTIDFFRFYEPNARILAGLTFNQVISVVLIVVGALLLARRDRKVAAAG
jgi:phosphatidylglycerol:prolipoprotein diacylglycerol transferase